MSEHNRFEELCALAVTGQISPSDSVELEAHLRICDTCRKAQADFVEIESLWLSPTLESAGHSEEIGSTLSQRILRRMQDAGAQFSRATLLELGGEANRSTFLRPRMLRVPAYAAAALALIAVGALFGAGIVANRLPRLETVVMRIPSTASAPPAAMQSTAGYAEQIVARRSEEQLAQKIAVAESERSRTQVQLEQAELRLATLQNASRQDASEITSLRATLEQARAQAADAQQQLAKLRDMQASMTADFVTAQYRAREAEDKLAEQTVAAERERQLLGAGREVRDIISARNLHIVDVADVGSSGVKKPFGRIFYTEGKSLIFYAYDLATPKGKQAFYAWGHREGDPHSTRMLGLVYNDDQAQKRWAFKFDDPKVLAEIDSVFVTLEPSDAPGEAPKGKKLLKAFLGTPPNHP